LTSVFSFIFIFTSECSLLTACFPFFFFKASSCSYVTVRGERRWESKCETRSYLEFPDLSLVGIL
jgi:hypothetical protein